jgi:hypothetical protein
MRMKKIIFIILILLWLGTVCQAMASGPLDMQSVNSEMPEISERLVNGSENRGVSSGITKKKTEGLSVETQNQATIIKIAIFACAFIVSGVTWRKSSKYIKKRNVQGYQGIRNRLR